jgi:hypothetical protein
MIDNITSSIYRRLLPYRLAGSALSLHGTALMPIK